MNRDATTIQKTTVETERERKARMNSEFFEALNALESEKGISKQYMLEKVEAALVSAFRKELGGAENVRVHLDESKGEVKVFRVMRVVEEVEDPATEMTLEDARKYNRRAAVEGTVEFELKTKEFSRISALAAKQVIIQAIREAERGMLIEAYESKKEDIISATVQKIDPASGNVVVDTGTSYATLRKEEQLPGDRFTVGQHIRVFVTEVRKESKGPLVTLSRTHPNFVKRLFELEVPEISDGTVVIMGIAREAGFRTKLAVMSRDEGVEPVGACIGNRGLRVNSVMEELHGEKIDLIKYSEDIGEYVKAALAPATVQEVIVEDEHNCRAIVEPAQLSLAIGKEGQNARLAARLTGCRVDIKTEKG